MTFGKLLPEWSRQDSILLTWPHLGTDFKNQLPELDTTYLELTRMITQQSHVKILCFDDIHQTHIKRLILQTDIPQNRYQFYKIKTNDVWIRDYGVLTVRNNDHTLTALKFEFNAWGGKYPCILDNRAMQVLFTQQGLPHNRFKTIPWVLEGGNLEVDGMGGLLSMRPCLLSATRNPEFSQEELENSLQELLGIERFLWLSAGGLAGDDTDGHIDLLARFCNHTTICYIHGNQEMKKELEAFRDVRGQPYDLVPLPMPKFQGVPASYVNFLINNGQVIVPVYQDKADDLALCELERLFPNRQIIPLDATILIQQGGGIHCATMQIPYAT